LSYADEKLVIASTDGFRLSEKALALKSDTKPFSTIIPSKTLMEVSKIFAASNEPLNISISDSSNMVVFQSEDTTVYTRILDGQYPDYKRIVPTSATFKANFVAEEFLEAVKLTNIFVKEGDSSTLKVRFDPEGVIRVASLSDESGYHESELAAEIEGEMLEIAFSAKYLLDFLNNVKCHKVSFETTGNKSACLLRPEEHENFFHIIMPIQL
jgi:DNA polymerase III subunit beta